MGTYEILKAAIAAIIRENGNNEITGNLLQQTLLSMVDSVGANAMFAGIATPETIPGNPEQNVFYIATQPGIYFNFNAVTVEDGEVVVFANKTGEWVKTVTGFASQSLIEQILKEWQEIKDANFKVEVQPHIERIDMQDSTAATIDPDKFYLFGEVATLAIGFNPGEAGNVAQYIFQFTSPAETPTSLSLPIGVKFPTESDSVLSIKGGRIYQISIADNLAIATSWEV